MVIFRARFPGVPIQLIVQFDDVHFQTLTAYVLEAVDMLARCWRAFNLELNPVKSAWCIPSHVAPPPYGGPIPLSTAGVVVCGSAAGTPDFICEHLHTKAQEASEIFRDLTAVAAYDDHLHLALILLSLCGPSQLVHLVRSHWPSRSREAVGHYDQDQWKWLQGQVLDGLTYDGFLEAVLALPCRKGGLGQRTVLSLVDHAFVGALALGLAMYADETHFPATAHNLRNNSNLRGEYEKACARIRDTLGPAAEQAEQWLRPWDTVLTESQPKVQHHLQRLLDDALAQRLWEDPPTYHETGWGLRIRATLQSGARPGARAWGTGVPGAQAIRLSSTEVRDAVRLLTGTPVDPLAELVTHCTCGAVLQPPEPHGDHFRTCDSLGEWLRSHNALLLPWVRIFREAGFSPGRDDRLFGALASQPAGKGQGDLMVPSWKGGRILLCDVRRTHPVQSDRACLHRAATLPGGHANQVEEAKRKSLNELLDRAVHSATLHPDLRGRIQLAPLVVDSYGSWGDTAYAVLQTCAEQFPPADRPAKLHWWRMLLSASLERENSRLLRCRTAEAWGAGGEPPEPPQSYWGAEEVPFAC